MEYITKNCVQCNELFTRKSFIAKHRMFCSTKCSQASRIKIQSSDQRKKRNLSECTLGDVIRDKRGASRYTTVRDNSRYLYRHITSCEHCSYNKHVEVCHKQPIHTFDLDTKISVINDRSNILILCPNCHWEFDHP